MGIRRYAADTAPGTAGVKIDACPHVVRVLAVSTSHTDMDSRNQWRSAGLEVVNSLRRKTHSPLAVPTTAINSVSSSHVLNLRAISAGDCRSKTDSPRALQVLKKKTLTSASTSFCGGDKTAVAQRRHRVCRFSTGDDHGQFVNTRVVAL